MKIIFVFFVAFVLNSSAISTPVIFLNVSTQPNGNTLNVVWATQSEVNNNYFVIERSTDSVNYTVIGNVMGSGNSNNQVNYVFNDNTVQPGEDYCYRISQYDFDGNFAFASVTCHQMALGLNDQERISDLQLKSFPNPVVNFFQLDWQDEIAFEKITLYDISGKLIFTSVLLLSETSIDMSRYPTGNYIYRLEGEGVIYSGKLVKE